MLRPALVLLASVLLFAVRPLPAVPGPEVRRIGDEFTVRAVARDALVATQDPFHASNVLLVRMADGTVVIASSPFDTEGTRALLAWVRSELRPTRMVAINTHFHPDGSGGNEAYAEAGVVTWASDLTQELIRERGQEMLALSARGFEDPARRRRVEATRAVPAARTFPAREGLTLDLGGEVVRVVHPGPAHSPDNVVVHVPARGLLFGGCMVKAGSSIGYTGDADVAGWEEAVRRLEPLAAAVVVPGHGPVGGPELLRNTVEVVRAERARRP